MYTVFIQCCDFICDSIIDMVKKILGRIDWNAFVAACKNIGLTELERLNIADAATFGDDILGEVR